MSDKVAQIIALDARRMRAMVERDVEGLANMLGDELFYNPRPPA